MLCLSPLNLPHDKCQKFAMADFVCELKDLASIGVPFLLKAAKDCAASVFAKEIGEAREALESRELGVCALDIPKYLFAAEKKVKLSALLAVALASNLMELEIDGVSGTPFTLFSASKAEEVKLTNAGLEYFTPEEKLGFHSDGALRANQLYVPEHIATFNLFLGYAKTGNFYWLPYSRWADADEFWQALEDKVFKLQLTPIAYSSAKSEHLDFVRNEVINCPVLINDRGVKSLFINGKVMSERDRDPALIGRLKESLRQSDGRIAVEQKENRLIVVRNSRGVHARDMFELPYLDSGVTRSMLRMIDRFGCEVTYS